MNLYEKVKCHCKHTTRCLNQHGQVLALYAIAFPMLFIFVFVGVDMGWYYLNRSRLQNAAEAAAIAGANTLKTNNDVKNVKKILLVYDDEYAGNETAEPTLDAANISAVYYANKNLNDTAESADAVDTETPAATSTITNSWTKGSVKFVTKDNKTENDKYITTLYKDDANNYYYYVVLQEQVSHLIMPGWFDDMPDEVHAVAKLTVSENGAPEHVTTPEVGEKEQEVLEELKNDNVIVGNWEVQNYYKESKARREAYKAKFGHDIYVKAWNHFQDLYNHHEINGATYRTETIVIQDSVGTSLKSDVVRTDASVNKINSNSYIYNSEGKPYSWERLDSINVDFKPEASLAYPHYLSDWDLQLGYLDGSKYAYNKWPADKGSIVNRGTLRIHSSIKIEQPYKVRSNVNYDAYSDSPDVAYPDVLWGRIESEPMIYEWNSSLKVAGLSSVRQIILSFNQSNTAKNDEGKYIYRPVILFYDGPERYDTENPLRESKPVIVNMNAPYRGVLYAPNSAVVVVGNKTDNFQGFIVAKEYKRLKTTADFEAEMAADPSKYTKGDNYFEEKTKVENPYYVAAEDHYTRKDNGYTVDAYSPEPKTIKWKYTKITEDGIEMYIDNYGNVQYMPYPDAPKKYGIYDNFGRTDFTTHGYSVVQESLYNMLVVKQ